MNIKINEGERRPENHVVENKKHPQPATSCVKWRYPFKSNVKRIREQTHVDGVLTEIGYYLPMGSKTYSTLTYRCKKKITR